MASEFFEQGDIEKNDLNLQPIVSNIVSSSGIYAVLLSHYKYVYLTVHSVFIAAGDRILQAMMDRRKKDELPKMQVGFIDAICITLYQVSYY